MASKNVVILLTVSQSHNTVIIQCNDSRMTTKKTTEYVWRTKLICQNNIR